MTSTATQPIRHANDGVSFLLLKQLRESKTNPRRMFDKKGLDELAESIRQLGLAQPLLVRQVMGKDGIEEVYEVVAGARRLRAAKLAALLEVPCFVRVMTDLQALELQLVENQQRKDVHPLDEGVAFREMIEQHGYTPEALATKLSRSERWVYMRMALAKLPAKVQEFYIEGQIDLSLAQLITTVPAEFQVKAAEAIVNGDYHGRGPMSFRQAKDFVDTQYRCTLKDAPFPTGQKDLVPDMGACSGCPHSTANQRGLFDQVVEHKDDAKAPALCTLPDCYHRKTSAAFELRAAEVEAKGGKVLRGKEAKKVGGEIGTEIDAICWADHKKRTWRKLLGKHVPPVTLIEGNKHQAPMEWVSTAALRKALKEAGHGSLVRAAPAPAAKASKSAAQSQQEWKVKQQEAERVRSQMRARLGPAVAAAGELLEARAAWRVIVRALCSSYGPLETSKRRGLELDLMDHRGFPQFRGKATRDAIEAMTVAQLQGLAFEVIAEEFETVSGELGIDEKKLAREVKDEEKASAKAAAAAKKAEAKKPKPAQTAAAKKAKKAKKAGKGKPKANAPLAEATCRVCGCTDRRACAVPDGCYWVEPDLCSECVGKEATEQ